jgi:hypothetical protein
MTLMKIHPQKWFRLSMHCTKENKLPDATLSSALIPGDFKTDKSIYNITKSSLGGTFSALHHIVSTCWFLL